MSDGPAPGELTPFALPAVLDGLKAARDRWRASHLHPVEYGAQGFPSRHNLERVVIGLGTALFPLRLGPAELNAANEDQFVEATLENNLSRLAAQVRLELVYQRHAGGDMVQAFAAEEIVTKFAAQLPEIRALLDEDVEAAFAGDPAARSVDEILICYPSITAVIHHRIAHALHLLGAPLVARIIAEIANSNTGIDIHPGATIGRGFFIDHGTGVVIGETAIVGNRVRLYQQVTLGAKRFPVLPGGKLARGEPRHPVIEDDVVIYAGATILGRVTIGRGSVIGGNVWLTHNVPPGSNVRQPEPNLSIESDDLAG